MSQAKFFFLALFLISISGLRVADAAEETKCEDSGKIYKVCRDQQLIFNEAAAKAASDKKILMVVFGADWCPWCRSLNLMLTNPELKDSYFSNTSLVEIGVYQEQEKLPSGEAVLDLVAGYSKGKINRKGIPLLALVDPEKKKAVFVDTAPLEKNTKVSKGHDPKKVSAAIKKAMAQLK